MFWNIFYACCIIFYYLLIKKCFLKEEKGKVRLLLWSLFINPVTLYYVLTSGTALALKPIRRIIAASYNRVAGIALVMAVVSIFYVLAIFLLSDRMGKWLRAYNRPLVTFVFLMYSVIFSLSLRKDLHDADSTLILYFLDIAGYIVLILACVLLYRFVIRSLSELTDRPRKITSGLFIVPPTIFLLFNSAFSIIAAFCVDLEGLFLIILYTDIMLFMFIWMFHVLIRNINATNEAIEAKDYAAEMARNEALREADLNIAKNIQSSALPSVFPPFPEHREFELFASMKAAKEVGGDFYDFYMLDDTTLAFLIADVSGKSIPGAMFMMRAKTVLKELALRGLPPGEVMSAANLKLCEGNDARMFVTAWMGFLDIHTGVVRAVNAGHNPPMLIRGGQAEYLKLKPSLIMGTFSIARYKEHTFTLEPGDILYLYTDGVTEAENAGAVYYGEENLQKRLSFGDKAPAPTEENGMAEAVCRLVEEELAEYTTGAEQSDDITMLCVRYIGG